MRRDEILRENLLALLTGEYARMSFDDAAQDFPLDRINENLPNSDCTPWGLLEHMRIAQEDILDFIKNPDYQEKEWPKEYWPKKGKKATPADWKKTINDFRRDFKELENIVGSPDTDLYQSIPWGDGITILREIVTLANHNAFHLGEFAIMRQAMRTWGEGHKPLRLSEASQSLTPPRYDFVAKLKELKKVQKGSTRSRPRAQCCRTPILP